MKVFKLVGVFVLLNVASSTAWAVNTNCVGGQPSQEVQETLAELFTGAKLDGGQMAQMHQIYCDPEKTKTTLPGFSDVTQGGLFKKKDKTVQNKEAKVNFKNWVAAETRWRKEEAPEFERKNIQLRVLLNPKNEHDVNKLRGKLFETLREHFLGDGNKRPQAEAKLDEAIAEARKALSDSSIRLNGKERKGFGDKAVEGLSARIEAALREHDALAEKVGELRARQETGKGFTKALDEAAKKLKEVRRLEEELKEVSEIGEMAQIDLNRLIKIKDALNNYSQLERSKADAQNRQTDIKRLVQTVTQTENSECLTLGIQPINLEGIEEDIQRIDAEERMHHEGKEARVATLTTHQTSRTEKTERERATLAGLAMQSAKDTASFKQDIGRLFHEAFDRIHSAQSKYDSDPNEMNKQVLDMAIADREAIQKLYTFATSANNQANHLKETAMQDIRWKSEAEVLAKNAAQEKAKAEAAYVEADHIIQAARIKESGEAPMVAMNPPGGVSPRNMTNAREAAQFAADQSALAQRALKPLSILQNKAPKKVASTTRSKSAETEAAFAEAQASQARAAEARVQDAQRQIAAAQSELGKARKVPLTAAEIKSYEQKIEQATQAIKSDSDTAVAHAQRAREHALLAQAWMNSGKRIPNLPPLPERDRDQNEERWIAEAIAQSGKSQHAAVSPAGSPAMRRNSQVNVGVAAAKDKEEVTHKTQPLVEPVQLQEVNAQGAPPPPASGTMRRKPPGLNSAVLGRKMPPAPVTVAQPGATKEQPSAVSPRAGRKASVTPQAAEEVSSNGGASIAPPPPPPPPVSSVSAPSAKLTRKSSSASVSTQTTAVTQNQGTSAGPDRGALLNQIHTGKQLRKVNLEAEKKKKEEELTQQQEEEKPLHVKALEGAFKNMRGAHHHDSDDEKSSDDSFDE